MNCCGKTMDGLDGDSNGGTFDGDVIITGDLNVEGGQLDLGVGPDGWSNIRSADAAFGLDLEAPTTKKIRLINGTTPIVEIDTNLNLIGSTGDVGLVPSSTTTTYDFIFPSGPGAATEVLTSQGPGLETYWSVGGGSGGGTVTSVALTVPAFLSVTGSPITTNGTFAVTLSGTPLPVLNGGTGTTTSTGTGSVVLSNSPSLTTPNIGVATGLIINLNGTTSGTVSIRVQPVAGTWNFNLPITAGTAGQVLTSQGGLTNAMTWTTPASPGTGTVTSVAMTVPTFLSVSGSPITTNGTFTVTLSGTPLPVLNGGTGTTTATGTSGSVVLSISPTITGTLTTSIISASGDISTSSTTPSTTTTTGAIRSGGGLGVVGNANIGGTLTSPNIAGSGQITAAGQLSTTATTASTSTTTGSLVSGGGAGIGGDLFVKQSVNVNYGGSFTAPQLKISPVTTGGISSLAFYRDVNNGSTAWVVGHGVGAVGDTNFAISSTLSGLNKIIITPSGPVQFPSGATSTTFINIIGSTSGTVTIQTQAVAGTYNYNLPITAGTSGQVLTSAGGIASPMTWTTPTIGTVTSVNMAVPTFLSVSGGPITTNGTFTVTLSGTPLPVLNGGTGVTTSTGSGSNVLSTSPTLTTPIFINPSTNNIGINGSTSGTVSILPQALFTSYNLNLPTSAGTAGQVLTSQGGGVTAMTWTNVGTGSVTSIAIAVPAFLNVSGSPIVSSGTITIGLSGSPLPILNGGTSTTTATGTVGSSVVLQNSPTITGTLTTGDIVCGRISAQSTLPHLLNNNGGSGIMVASYDPSAPDPSDRFIQFGMSATSSGATNIGYSRRSTGQGSFASIGLAGSGAGSVNVYFGNIAATSTTTGTVTIPGGLGLTSSIFSGGSITATSGITTTSGGANITGNSTLSGTLSITSTAGGLRLSPTITGNERSIGFYGSPNATGSLWVLGVGIAAPGDTFSIFNANFSANIFTIGYTTGLTTLKSLSVTDTTASTSTTTGSVVVGGGAGFGGAINALQVSTLSTQPTTLGTGINNFINNTNSVNGFIATFQNQSMIASSDHGIFIGMDPATVDGIGINFVKGVTAASNRLRIFHTFVGDSAFFYPPGTSSTSTTTGTVTVNGGLGVNGAVTATSFNITTPPTSFAPSITCATHSITINSSDSYYIKIGKLVTLSFSINFNIGTGSNNDLFMTLPFTAMPLIYSACTLDRTSDMTPGASDASGKTYEFQINQNLATGRFSRHGADSGTYFQYGGVGYSNVIVRGTITYFST